jgi:hypothetical protein
VPVDPPRLPPDRAAGGADWPRDGGGLDARDPPSPRDDGGGAACRDRPESGGGEELRGSDRGWGGPDRGWLGSDRGSYRGGGASPPRGVARGTA